MGMAVVTYIPRFLPSVLLSSRPLPPRVIAWLRNVPVSVLSAMLLPSLLIRDERLELGLDNVFVWAAIPTLIVAWKTRSLFGSVLTGMLAVALWRYLAG